MPLRLMITRTLTIILTLNPTRTLARNRTLTHHHTLTVEVVTFDDAASNLGTVFSYPSAISISFKHILYLRDISANRHCDNCAF